MRASRRSVSDMTADQCGGITERKSHSSDFSQYRREIRPKAGISRADTKSALSVRKHGDMRHVSEKRDFITMLVRGRNSPKTP